MNPEVLSERILEKQGSYTKKERYLKGWHPNKGQLTLGWKGNETREIIDSIRPIITVIVKK